MHSQLYIKLMNSVRWRRLRNEYLTQHPDCEECKRQGYIKPAQCVHHVTPVESGRTDRECTELAFNWYNLQALCYQCHSAIHQAEGKGTKQNVKERKEQSLQRWIERNTPKSGEQ